MRVWGRITNPDGSRSWVEVSGDPQGREEAVWLTAFVQCLKLQINESPFYADYGIPAQLSVVQQIFPDFYVNQMQSRYAPRFAMLTVAKVDSITPTYNIVVMTFQGTKIALQVPV